MSGAPSGGLCNDGTDNCGYGGDAHGVPARPTAVLIGPAMLFCPGHQPALFGKATSRADLVVIDLEDAVPAAERAAARAAIVKYPLDAGRTLVRINAVGTTDHALDLEALRRTDYRTVMLAKAETPEQIAGLADWDVVALCETPRGVLNAAAIATADNLVGLMWGSEDLMAALGAGPARSADGRLTDVAAHARWQVLLAASASGRQAVDTVFPDFSDTDGLAGEAASAVAAGFDLKACIHPRQVEIVRAQFRPTEAQLAWASRIVGTVRNDGVSSVDGHMVDAPVLRQAHSILARRAPDSTRR